MRPVQNLRLSVPWPRFAIPEQFTPSERQGFPSSWLTPSLFPVRCHRVRTFVLPSFAAGCCTPAVLPYLPHRAVEATLVFLGGLCICMAADQRVYTEGCSSHRFRWISLMRSGLCEDKASGYAAGSRPDRTHVARRHLMQSSKPFPRGCRGRATWLLTGIFRMSPCECG